MDKSRRKALMQEYADRKQPVGVYAVRCSASGEVWVAWSRNVDKRWNALAFQLTAGNCPETGLQASWTRHGAESFAYEILEELEESDPHVLERLLPERADLWRAKLNAAALDGF